VKAENSSSIRFTADSSQWVVVRYEEMKSTSIEGNNIKV